MTIATVYRTLWRHKLFVILLTGALVAAVYVFTARQTKLYTASSLVRVEQQVSQGSDLYGSLLTGERLARTYALIAETSSVRQLVRERVGGSVPDDAIAVDAGQVSNLELLRLGVTYADPEIAARVANAVPGALAEFVRRNGTSSERIITIERARPPSVPSSPNVRLNLMLAVLLGVILASGLVLLIEAFSDRVGSVEDLERATGHPVIAAIPPLTFVSDLGDMGDGTVVQAGERMRRPRPQPRRAEGEDRPARVTLPQKRLGAGE